MKLEWKIMAGLTGLCLGGSVLAAGAPSLPPLQVLPKLHIDLAETTVSGISSGAYMAVQMGVVKSSRVRGVAATAGGPYMCATNGDIGSSTAAVSRCMQGDPAMLPAATDRLVDPTDGTFTYPFQGKAQRDVERMAKGQRIDPIGGIGRQAIWVFHGYNDGIVKLPVSQALVGWYTGRHPNGRSASGMTPRLPASQVFHKDDLNAGHAQISTACTGDHCNPCDVQGGAFINSCPLPEQAPYDAAGSALQMFYGRLTRTGTGSLGGRFLSFGQQPFLKLIDGKTPVKATDEIAMGEEGYLYVPKACEDGSTTCRLHIAFHGCMQSATDMGKVTGRRDYFARNAGVNEWADANRIVVLYPQATPTNAVSGTALSAAVNPMSAAGNALGSLGQAMASYDISRPFNPMGCWDWWGYNDDVPARALSGQWPAGSFASSQGVQIAAVWRMAKQLADPALTGTLARAAVTASRPEVTVLDRTATQALLRWEPVQGADRYKVYRTGGKGSPVASETSQPFFADSQLEPQTSYRYVVRAIVKDDEKAPSDAVSVTTAKAPPACDPYFSLAQNQVVGRDNKPLDKTCQ
jgi:poly(3-hydroxybutyrate) depolymerase